MASAAQSRDARSLSRAPASDPGRPAPAGGRGQGLSPRIPHGPSRPGSDRAPGSRRGTESSGCHLGLGPPGASGAPERRALAEGGEGPEPAAAKDRDRGGRGGRSQSGWAPGGTQSLRRPALCGEVPAPRRPGSAGGSAGTPGLSRLERSPVGVAFSPGRDSGAAGASRSHDPNPPHCPLPPGFARALAPLCPGGGLPATELGMWPFCVGFRGAEQCDCPGGGGGARRWCGSPKLRPAPSRSDGFVPKGALRPLRPEFLLLSRRPPAKGRLSFGRRSPSLTPRRPSEAGPGVGLGLRGAGRAGC